MVPESPALVLISCRSCRWGPQLSFLSFLLAQPAKLHVCGGCGFPSRAATINGMAMAVPGCRHTVDLLTQGDPQKTRKFPRPLDRSPGRYPLCPSRSTNTNTVMLRDLILQTFDLVVMLMQHGGQKKVGVAHLRTEKWPRGRKPVR